MDKLDVQTQDAVPVAGTASPEYKSCKETLRKYFSNIVYIDDNFEQSACFNPLEVD